jgi:hypothetical protein
MPGVVGSIFSARKCDTVSHFFSECDSTRATSCPASGGFPMDSLWMDLLTTAKLRHGVAFGMKCDPQTPIELLVQLRCCFWTEETRTTAGEKESRGSSPCAAGASPRFARRASRHSETVARRSRATAARSPASATPAPGASEKLERRPRGLCPLGLVARSRSAAAPGAMNRTGGVECRRVKRFRGPRA